MEVKIDQSLDHKGRISKPLKIMAWLLIRLKLRRASLEGFRWSVEATKSSIEVLYEGGNLGKVLNQIYLQLKIHIKVVSEQPPIEAWKQNVESLFYSYGVREEEKPQLVLNSLSYEVNYWWDSKCEKRRIGVRPIKTWSLIKQTLWDIFGVGNHEEQRQGQEQEKIMESSTGEKSTKANKLSQAQDVLYRKVIHHEKKNTCTFVRKEKSREEEIKSVVSTKESERKRKESECLIENHESLKEEQVNEKKNEMEKSERTKEKGDKGEEMKDSRCDVSSSLNSLSTEEVNLFTNSNNHFLACFPQTVQKFEAQNMENTEILGYKLYKTISFLPSTSFLSFDFIINKSNSCFFLSFVNSISIFELLTYNLWNKDKSWNES
ncbi:hypothetical protein M9H77_03287 [Catharanthus roseus]|uniref:Uncharacterized protein n=1 Tax=Catharanthus roseus TaxID=4058 RepID=A0ACC0CAZ9_CATRO|nr:hypothetical protein M9H77_03287 [Catharanthus roseus]